MGAGDQRGCILRGLNTADDGHSPGRLLTVKYCTTTPVSDTVLPTNAFIPREDSIECFFLVHMCILVECSRLWISISYPRVE